MSANIAGPPGTRGPNCRSGAGNSQPGDAETRRLYDAITSEKVLAEFNPDVGEWGQCEGVALSRTIRSSMTGSTGSWRADLLVIPRYPNSR
jgi:hypothetical protein